SGTGNRILINSIFSNAGLGIDLFPPGVTDNDLGDGDSGANNLQNFPVLVSATGSPLEGSMGTSAELASPSSATITGTLNSTANTTFIVDFWFGGACEGSGHQHTGSIPIYLDSKPVTTDSNGNASFSFFFTLPGGATSGFVNCKATNPGGDTSEYSECIA